MPRVLIVGKWRFPVYLFGLAFTLLPVRLPADETVYRCIDAAGRQLYQQTPCIDSAGELVEIEVDNSIWEGPDDAAAVIRRGVQRPQASAPARASGSRTAQEKQCWKRRQRMEKIEWRLRKGYRPAEGERLRQQRREIEAYLREFCR